MNRKRGFPYSKKVSFFGFFKEMSFCDVFSPGYYQSHNIIDHICIPNHINNRIGHIIFR